MRFSLLIAVLLLSISAFAQPFQLQFEKSPTPYFLGINGKLVDTIPHQSYRIDSLKSQQVTFWIVSDSLRFKTMKKTVFLTAGKQAFKVDTLSRDSLIVSEKQEATLANTKPKDKTTFVSNPNVFCQLSLDSLLTLVEVNTYMGETGCTNIISDKDFDALLATAKDNIFESDKVKLMQKSVEEHCLKTHQMEQFLKLISYEDERLDFLLKNKNRIFNLSELEQLQSVFVIQTTKDKFIQAIQN